MNHGRFIWPDLMSTDPETAAAFYAGLFDWHAIQEESPPGSGNTYQRLHLGELPVAGIVHLTEPGLPSHWMVYLGVDDVAASLGQVTEMGGKVCFGPIQVPGKATFAVCTDNQGAAFSILQPEHSMPPADSSTRQPGLPCWGELWAQEPEKAAAFYGALCGWTEEFTDMGDAGVYRVQSVAGIQVGGIMKAQDPSMPSCWCPYFTVAGIDAAAEKAAALGGRVVMPGSDIPETGRFALLADPSGGVFAVFRGKD